MLFGQRDGVGSAAEVLAPDLFGTTGVRHQAEVVADLIGAAEEVDAVGFDTCVAGGQLVIGIGRVSTVICGEMTGFEEKIVELFARQLEAGGYFR
ncbi:hypothetical protein D3C72_1482440 [compost metagenome]